MKSIAIYALAQEPNLHKNSNAFCRNQKKHLAPETNQDQHTSMKEIRLNFGEITYGRLT
jgi:hypothetical protein